MADATFVYSSGVIRVTPAAAVAVGEVWQLSDGRAAVYPGGKDGRTAADASKRTNFETTGIWTFPLTASISILAGGRVYWDYSASAAHFKKVNDRDFYLGRATDDSNSSTVTVDINVDPPYDVDVSSDAVETVHVGTQGLNTMGVFRRGGSHKFILSTANEAQKMDILSVEGFPKESNPIIEFAFRVASDGAGTVVDVSVGIANATHATDADSITDSVFMHLNANDVNIYFESDDTTASEVAATDSTIDYTEGATLSVRKEVWLDCRDSSDIQIYVDGVLVLGSTVFTLAGSSATFFLLAHIEKTAAADAYEFNLDWFRARKMDQ